MLENKNTNNLEESFELNINEQESSSKKDLINYQDESPLNNSFNKINKSFLASSSSKSLTRVNDDYKNINRKFQLLSMEKIPKKKLNNLGRKEEENQDYIKILGRKSFAGNYQNKKPNFKELKENDMPNSDGVGGDKQNLIYPVNIFHEFLFSWTVRLFRIALRFGQLKIKHLGKFAQELSPTVFLKEILEKWEKYYQNNKSKILLKTLISSNICSLIIICFIGIIVTFLDILTIIFYRQILLHFDIKHYNKEDIMDQIYYPLLSTIVIMLFSKLFHIFLLRYFQFLTMKVGAKIIIQINTLIYNKLLKISPYASISEGDLVNYIQLDAENFGEFFSFTPAIIVLIIKIIFCIYLLFTYFGLTFIFGLISLIIILALFSFIQAQRSFYKKELLILKDQRMTTTTQVLNTIKMIKLNSWERHFNKKIDKERNNELTYLKKIQTLTLFINALAVSTKNITCLISITAYNFFNKEMDISNILTSLYIFENLGEPLFLLPEYISGFLDSLISLRRLEEFLFSKEYNSKQINKKGDNDSKYAIYIEDLNFGILKEEAIDEDLISINEKLSEDSNPKNDNKKPNKKMENNEEQELDEIILFEDKDNKLEKSIEKEEKVIAFKKLGHSSKLLPFAKKIKKQNDNTNNKFAQSPVHYSRAKISFMTAKLPLPLNKKSSSSIRNSARTSSGIIKHNSFTQNKTNNIQNNRCITEEVDNLGDDKKYKLLLTEESSIIESSRDLNNSKYEVSTSLLKNITLKVEFGDLVGIVGDTGCGKTCLLNAILNNLDILDDFDQNISQIIVNGSISYVPQIPWIINDTIKGNILFNQEYEEERYQHIIKICELEKDLLSFSGSDFSRIGDKGGEILSNGQKIRISIARAVYSDSDIYLFDDPLSALEPSISKMIFNQVIKEYLKSKTVLIATHELQFIPLMKHVIHMNRGRIDFYGTAEEAMEQKFFKKFKEAQIKKMSEDNNDKTINDEKNKNNEKETLSELNDTDLENITNQITFKPKKKNFNPGLVNKKNNIENNNNNKEIVPTFQSIKLIINYSGGLFFVILLVLTNIIWKTCESSSDYVIMSWSLETQKENKIIKLYLIVYVILSLLSIIFIFFRTFPIVEGSLKYNQNMHNSLLEKLLKAPVNLFHDIIPHSHLLNRLSKDLENSIKFFWSINSGSRLFFELLSCLIVAILFNGFCFIPYPIMVYAEYRIFQFYIKGGRALNNLETTARAQIITKFSETLNGIVSIRGFESEETFRKKYHEKLYDFYRVLIYQNGTTQWFALNLDLVSFCILFFILVFSWLFEKIVNPFVMGLLIGYTLKMIQNTYGFFEQYMMIEKTYPSMESCEAYTHIVQEKEFHTERDTELKKKNFPQNGKIQFINYWVKYRPDLNYVLKNLNFTIMPGEKIGVVGKTGSGKSTLCLGLFRILEATKGRILIDDIDISKIGLNLLRDSISLIPQDPKLIDGTLRENIDPLGKYNDEDILFQINLIGFQYIMEDSGLDIEIKADGTNLSVGEKQLICIVRALLRKSKIILMDEATSAFDYNTEKLIQNSLMKSFKDCTLITIAHKIKTVMDYDRIFVFEAGELIDSGKPKELIKKKKGLFYDLYSHSYII